MIEITTEPWQRNVKAYYACQPQFLKEKGYYRCDIEVKDKELVQLLAAGEHRHFEIDGNKWEAMAFQTIISKRVHKTMIALKTAELDWDKLRKEERVFKFRDKDE